MLNQAFNEVYTKFKLHFYQEIFRRFQDREASLTTVETFCMESIMALGRLVYGASNRDLEHIFDEEGCDCSHIVFEHSGWQPKVTSGVLREDCLAVLDDYFRPLVEQKS